MAHIFKHPDSTNKGIITLTHKEVAYFNDPESSRSLPHRIKRAILKRVFNKVGKGKLFQFYQDSINQIKENYLIGVHFGWSHQDYAHHKYVDFYMGSKTTASFTNDVFYIPLDGSCFIPKFFYQQNPKSHMKYWDILCVSRDARFKNLDLFMREIKKMYENGVKVKVLLLIPANKLADNDPTKTYVELFEDYIKMFTFQERELFTILKLHPDMPYLGLTQKQVALFYHMSKVFTLFSQEEGGSRVISEALLAGLPVVVKDDLRGGGLDALDKNNSILFDKFDNAHLALTEAVKKSENLALNNEEVAKEVREDYAIEKLKGYLKKLYNQNNMVFDGELINTDRLSYRLNAHLHDSIPWATNRFATPDIITKEQFEIFLSHLEKGNS